MSHIVESVFNIVLFFDSSWFVFKLQKCPLCRIMHLIFRNRNIIGSIDDWDGSVVCTMFFITFFIYSRYDSYSRANIHGTKVFPGFWKVFIKLAVRLSFPEDFIFVWEFIDFVIFSRKMFASQWWNCLFEIFF